MELEATRGDKTNPLPGEQLPPHPETSHPHPRPGAAAVGREHLLQGLTKLTPNPSHGPPCISGDPPQQQLLKAPSCCFYRSTAFHTPRAVRAIPPSINFNLQPLRTSPLRRPHASVLSVRPVCPRVVSHGARPLPNGCSAGAPYRDFARKETDNCSTKFFSIKGLLRTKNGKSRSSPSYEF